MSGVGQDTGAGVQEDDGHFLGAVAVQHQGEPLLRSGLSDLHRQTDHAPLVPCDEENADQGGVVDARRAFSQLVIQPAPLRLVEPHAAGHAGECRVEQFLGFRERGHLGRGEAVVVAEVFVRTEGFQPGHGVGTAVVVRDVES